MKIQLKRSSVLTNGEAKQPLDTQVDYGELAVNFNEADPCIFIKDSADNIVRIAEGSDPTTISEGNTSASVEDNGTDGYFKVITEGTEQFRVSSDGNVGIGEDNPQAKLDVNGSVIVSEKITSASTVDSDSGGTLATKDYVDTKDVAPGNGTITVTQPGSTTQTFSVNQSGNTTIALKNDNTQTIGTLQAVTDQGNTTTKAASFGGQVTTPRVGGTDAAGGWISFNTGDSGSWLGFKATYGSSNKGLYRFYKSATAGRYTDVYFAGSTSQSIAFPDASGTVALTSSTVDNADKVDGYHATTLNTGSTAAVRDSSGDVAVRLIRSDYANSSSISGGMVFRVNNGSDNYLRTCNSPTNIRAYLAAPSTGGSGATGTWPISITGQAAAVTIGYSNNSNATYQMLWGSGSGVYGTGGITCNPSSNTIFASTVQGGTLYSSGRVRAGNHSASNVAFANNSEQGSGLGFPTNENVALFANGTKVLAALSNGQMYFGASPDDNMTPGQNNTKNGINLKSGGQLIHKRNSSNNTGAAFMTGGSTGFLDVRNDGDCMNTNGRYEQTSDFRIKERITPAKSQWEDIKALNWVNYRYKAETNLPQTTQLGIVAQDAELVCPGIVSENEVEGTPWTKELQESVGETYKSVAYSLIAMKSAAALKEALIRIEELEARLDALES